MSKTHNEFITEANAKFNDKFNYPEEYKGIKVKIRIICPIHGDFWQSPCVHLRSKHGCKNCSNDIQSITKSKTFEQFKKDASDKFDGKFNYDNINYIDYYTVINFECPIHSKFSQSPYNHLQSKYGCSKCAHDENIFTKKHFVGKADIKFKNKFDYSKVIYDNNTTLIIITCPVHGDFTQSSSDHLRSKYGCSKCANDKITIERSKNNEIFILEANIIHNNMYGYKKID